MRWLARVGVVAHEVVRGVVLRASSDGRTRLPALKAAKSKSVAVPSVSRRGRLTRAAVEAIWEAGRGRPQRTGSANVGMGEERLCVCSANGLGLFTFRNPQRWAVDGGGGLGHGTGGGGQRLTSV